MTRSIVILHGWTYKKKKLFSLKKELEKRGFRVFLPTLPGFDKKSITKPWQLNDYVIWLNKFLTKNKIQKTILIGHSFGGQIATKFFLLYPTKVEILVLISAAVIRKKAPLMRRFIVFTSKNISSIFKSFPFNIFYQELRFLLYKFLGEGDYYKTNPVLQKTMVNILSENLEKDLHQISIPTLILWGKKDRTTKLKRARIIDKKIPHSKLVIFKKANHALPYNKPREVAHEIVNFLG